MDLFFLGLDGLDEAVAPSLGLHTRRGVRTVDQIYHLGSTTVLFAYAQVDHDVFTRARADFVQLF